MSRKGICAVELALRDMPVEDRLSALLLTIIDKNPSAAAVSFTMLSALVTLSKNLSAENRARIADALRNAADRLEWEELERV